MERSTVQSCLAAPAFFSQKPLRIGIDPRFPSDTDFTSAISAGTDPEDLCQLKQSWHNRSHFVPASHGASTCPKALQRRPATQGWTTAIATRATLRLHDRNIGHMHDAAFHPCRFECLSP